MTAADQDDISALAIGVLGGTGDQGRGLARRFALAGHRVIIGSRDAGRATEAAADLGAGPADFRRSQRGRRGRRRTW